MRAVFRSLVVLCVLASSSFAVAESVWVGAPPPYEPHVPCAFTPGSTSFSTFVEVDGVRPGGEPVIAATPRGTLLMAVHPGETHAFVEPTNGGGAVGWGGTLNGMTHIFRSTDCGVTWSLVGLPDAPGRGAQPAISDPDFAVDAWGNIWYTDFTKQTVNVALSKNDGQSFFFVNLDPFAAPRARAVAEAPGQGDAATRYALGTDRPWLAVSGNTLYLSGLIQGKHVILAADTTDVLNAATGTLVFEERGFLPGPCKGDIVASPLNGDLYAACSDARSFMYSRDGGVSWTQTNVPVSRPSNSLQEPGIDAEGNVYVAGGPAGSPRWPILLARSTDRGSTFSILDLGLATKLPNVQAAQWSWVSAGSAGNVAVSFLGTSGDPTSIDALWYVYSVLVTGAGSPAPGITAVRVTDEPVHRGPICESTLCFEAHLMYHAQVLRDEACAQSPDSCELASTVANELKLALCQQGATDFCSPPGPPDSNGEEDDRRMGDFFETTLDKDGILHVAVGGTERHPTDWVGHALHAHVTSGVTLKSGAFPTGFPLQG